MSITKTSIFQTIRAAKPNGEKSHSIFTDVSKAEATLETPLSQNSNFRVGSYLPFSKINAIKMNDRPIPPQPYISNAQANEPGFDIVNATRIFCASGALVDAKYGT